MTPTEKIKLKSFQRGVSQGKDPKELEFRQRGGVEMLANRARGISTDNASDPNRFVGNQATASVYKDMELRPASKKSIEADVGSLIHEQRQAGFHSGSPSSAKSRGVMSVKQIRGIRNRLRKTKSGY